MQSGDAEGRCASGLRETAAAGTGAAIAMVAAIVPFAMSELVVVRQLGVAVAVAIILDALIVRPVLLPAARRGPRALGLVADVAQGAGTATGPQPVRPARAPEPRPPGRGSAVMSAVDDGRRPPRPTARCPAPATSGSTASSTRARAAAGRVPRVSTRRRVDRIVLGDGRRRARARRRARRAGDGGDRLRRARGQGRQELHRHRVPLRLPQGQALGRRDRRGRRARRSSTSPSRSASCSRCCRSPTRPRPRCSRRSSRPRRATRSSSARRRARRAAPTRRDRDPAARRRGRRACRPTRCRSIPDPTLDASQYLFHHPGVDLIWTTGGPKAVAAANEAGKPCIGVGPGQRAGLPARAAPTCAMAVVDMLISKTFDSSVICPAEQTLRRRRRDLRRRCVAELERHGRARARRRTRSSALAAVAFDDDGRAALAALGRSCADLAALAGIAAASDAKVLVAPLPADLDALAAHPLLQEKLMPVLGARALALGRARARRLRARHRARRPRPHLGGLRARRGRRRRASRERIRTGRILVNAPTAVGALGGDLHRDAADLLARLRHVGRLDDDRQRQLPQPAQHQGGLAPPGAAAVVPRARRTPTSTRARSTACATLRARARR